MNDSAGLPFDGLSATWMLPRSLQGWIHGVSDKGEPRAVHAIGLGLVMALAPQKTRRPQRQHQRIAMPGNAVQRLDGGRLVNHPRIIHQQ